MVVAMVVEKDDMTLWRPPNIGKIHRFLLRAHQFLCTQQRSFASATMKAHTAAMTLVALLRDPYTPNAPDASGDATELGYIDARCAIQRPRAIHQATKDDIQKGPPFLRK